MKKRIISLILVVVMSLLTLSGCAYKYEDDDMTNYATFDAEKFLKALGALDIEDGDFGTDEEQRWLKVEDAIRSTLASKTADKTVHVNEGKVGKYDILYYSYFYTVTVGEGEEAETFFFDTSKLTEASSNVQFGLSSNKEGTLAGEIEQALAGKFEFVKDNSETADKNEANYYITSKPTKVEPKEGKYLVVNVTYEVATEDAEGKTNPVKHTNEMISVPYMAEGTEAKTFAEQLFGKEVNKALETITVKIDDTKSEIYTNVKINFVTNIADSDLEPIVIGDDEGETIKYEMKSSDKEDTSVTDAYGNKTTAGALNGKNMVYYVLPVYYVDVEEELTVETLLYKVFGENLSSSSLEMFGANSNYKNGEDKISALVDALKTKIKEYNTAEKAKTTAETTYTSKLSALKTAITGEGAADKKAQLENLAKTALEKYEAKQNATGDAATTAKNEYDAAYKALTDYLNGTEIGATEKEKTEFKSAYDTKLTTAEKLVEADKARTEAKDKVLGCLPSKEVMAREIVQAYKDSQYDSLDSAYRTEVTEAVADKIIHLAKECIKYTGKYPEKALKDAIKRVENELKSDFYTGNYSGTDTTLKDKTNYVAFDGSYTKYVVSVAELGLKSDATKDDINNAIRAKAEKAVQDVILVYTLVDFLNENTNATIYLTKEEEKNIKTQVSNYENAYEYDFKAALMLDKVFEYFMKTSPRGDKPSKVNKPASGTSAAYELYLEQMAKYNSVNFKNVKIAVDTEDAE